MLLNQIEYMIMACILLYFYCMKYLMYMTVVIMIVVGTKVFLTFEPLKNGMLLAVNQ